MSGPTEDLDNILLIQTAFIGDVILATSLVEAARQRWPNAHIDMLVRSGNETLLADHPHLRQVLVWHKKRAKYQGLWHLLRHIRRQRYDLVCTLQRFAATGWLTACSGARLRVGFKANPFSAAFTHRVPHNLNGKTAQHEIERNYKLLAAWLPAVPVPPPRLYPSEDDFRHVLRGRPYVCIAPSSVWFTKQWPEARWIDLIGLLPAEWDVLLLGGPDDRAVCNRIVLACGGRPQNLAGTLTLLQSAALMAGARMNYVNDSAPMHLCSAMDAPVTAVFCSTVPRFGFTPLSGVSRVVETSEALDCRPCGIHGHKACPKGHFRCANIPAEKVLAPPGTDRRSSLGQTD